MGNRLPDKLTQLRKHYGYSQGDIAEKLAIPVTEYIKWENGNTIPHTAQMSLLAKVYGITVGTLIDNNKTIVFRQVQSLNDSVEIPFIGTPADAQEDTDATEIYDRPEEGDTAPLEETKLIDTQPFAPTVANVIVDEPTLERPAAQADRAVKKDEPEDRKKISMYILAGVGVLIALIGLFLLLNRPEGGTNVALSGTNRLAVGRNFVIYIDKNGALQTRGSVSAGPFEGCVQVSANDTHIMGLKSDGTVVTSDNDPSVAEWKNAVMIAAGRNHSAALKKDGTVYCTGDTKACSAVADWSDISEVYAGNGITLGLKKDGTLLACGTDAANGETSVRSASVGPNDIAVIYTDGRAKVFPLNGANAFDTSAWTDISEITVGGSFVCGVSSSGRTYCLGAEDTIGYVANLWNDIRYIGSNSQTLIAADRSGGLHGAGDNTYNLYNEGENPTPEGTAPTESLSMVSGITFAETTANVTVKWNAVENAEYYSVTIDPQLNINLPNTQITSISIPASALKSGRHYTLTVTAYPADPNVWLPSDPASVEYTYNAKTIQLESPGNIKGRIPEEGVWRISWDEVKNAGSYTFVLDGGEEIIVYGTSFDLHPAEFNLLDDSTHNISVTANPADEASAYVSSEPSRTQLTFRLSRFTVTVSYNDPGNGSVELSLPAGTYALKDILIGENLPTGYMLADPEKKVTINSNTYLEVSVIPADGGEGEGGEQNG